MSRRIAALTLAVVGLTVGCSSTSSSGGTLTASTTTSVDPSASSTTLVTTTTAPAVSSTVVATVPATVPPTVPPTVAPAPPATNAPKPPSSTAAPAPAGPTLSSVRLRDPFPPCNPGDVVTITIVFSTANAAGVTVWSSQDGDLGQYPAEFGGVEVQHTCINGQTLYTLYPVAEGGALGTPVDLYV